MLADRITEPEGEDAIFDALYDGIMALFVEHRATRSMTDQVLEAVKLGLDVVLACRPCKHNRPTRMYAPGYSTDAKIQHGVATD
jgi:hypothetical protein